MWNRQSLTNPCVKLQVAIIVLLVLLYGILFVSFHSWNVIHEPFIWFVTLHSHDVVHKIFGGMCNMVNLAYLVHWVHVWFYFHFSYLKLCKPLVIIVQMHQCLSALLLTELFGVLNENFPCFKAVLHLRVVCIIMFGFLFSYFDHCKPVSNHLHMW